MKFDSRYIDTAFVNGRVITVNPNDDEAEAVGVKGNKIVFVGRTADLMTLVSPDTKIIDLNGRSLLPGFNDAHFHPILTGMCSPDGSTGM